MTSLAKEDLHYPTPSYLQYQPKVGLTRPLTDIFQQVGKKVP